MTSYAGIQVGLDPDGKLTVKNDAGLTSSGYPGTAPAASSGTTFPATPADGQSFFYTADATNGIVWHFRYRAASASTFKWEYVGGSPLFAGVNNSGAPGSSETTTSATYTALSTAGPSITCPLNGDYQVETGFTGNQASNQMVMSFDIGGTGASDNDATWGGTGTIYFDAYGTRVKTAIATATALVSKYRVVTSGTADFRNRWMRVTPVRTLGS